MNSAEVTKEIHRIIDHFTAPGTNRYALIAAGALRKVKVEQTGEREITLTAHKPMHFNVENALGDAVGNVAAEMDVDILWEPTRAVVRW